MSGWKDGVISFVAVTVLSQSLRLVDTESPSIILAIRSLYFAATATFYAILFYIYTLIQAKNDERELTYTDSPSLLDQDSNGPVNIITTYREYDTDELLKFARNSLISVAVSVFVHTKFGYLQPLFIQSFLPLKNIYSTPLVKIYLRNIPAEGDLRRPFTVSNNPLTGTKVAEGKKKSYKSSLAKKK